MPYKDPIKAKEYAKAYREKNKEKHKEYYAEWIKDKDLSEYKSDYYKKKRYDKYGITREDFEAMLDNQNHSCKICLIHFDEIQRPYIDHCHNTGKVRGLLCMNCNAGLGQFKDNLALLANAMEYLEDNND